MRRAHILKHNIRGESPQRLIFFDTETNDVLLSDHKKKLTLKLGEACFVRRGRPGKWMTPMWFEFHDANDFWTWVTANAPVKTKTYLFAHNLVFDMAVTGGFEALPGLGWKLEKAIVDDPPTVLEYRKGKSTLCLLDTFNWFHSSLAELGKSIGREKLPMPLENDPVAKWTEYCRQDVTVIKDAMLVYLDFIKTNDLGNFQHTQASQAFTAYRHRFMGHRVLIDDNRKALDLARTGYYGGRVEAFFIGEQTGDFYLVDVNSMYPFVMSIFDFPAFLRSVYSRVALSELAETIGADLAIGDVTLDSPEPVFPLRAKTDLLFPVGNFRTVLPTPELRYALDRGYIQRVHKLAVYQGEPLFRRYVETMYHLRQEYKAEGNRPFEYLCKLMLNSLYGKFGQTGRVYRDERPADSLDVKSWEEWDAETHSFVKYRQFGGLVQTYKNEGESFNSHPAIAAHVTSYARMWLWKLIETAGRENVFYCDTDSLVVNKTGYDSLAGLYLGNNLGELKLERQFDYLVIRGPKDYQFGGVTKIKGVRKNAVQTAPDSYRQDKFSRFKGMVAAGDLGTMIVSKETKVLKRDYKKGEIMDGGAVRPLTYYVDEAGKTCWSTLAIEPEHLQQFDHKYQPKSVRLLGGETPVTRADRMAIAADELEARRAGEMLYQRGKPRPKRD